MQVAGHGSIKVATARNTIVPRTPQLSSETEVSIALLYQLCSTYYTAVRIKKSLKSTSVLKVATMKNYVWFLITQSKPLRATTKSTLFTVSKDEWNTKEGTGKSLKNTLHALRCAKRHLSGWSNVEQWKNQARSLSRYRVMLDWRHQSVRQSVSQAVRQSVRHKKIPLNNFFFKIL